MSVNIKGTLQREHVLDMMHATYRITVKLLKQDHPTGLGQMDVVRKQLTRHNPCRDPGAALKDMRRWQRALVRLTGMDMGLPEVDML